MAQGRRKGSHNWDDSQGYWQHQQELERKKARNRVFLVIILLIIAALALWNDFQSAELGLREIVVTGGQSLIEQVEAGDDGAQRRPQPDSTITWNDAGGSIITSTPFPTPEVPNAATEFEIPATATATATATQEPQRSSGG